MGHNISPKNSYERERWMGNNCAKENVLEGGISHLVCKFAALEITYVHTRFLFKFSKLLIKTNI